MGTLLEQPPRNLHDRDGNLESNIKYYKDMAKKTGVTFDQVILVSQLMERARTNDLYHANGDIHDEQMSGFGEIAMGIRDALISISEKMDIEK